MARIRTVPALLSLVAALLLVAQAPPPPFQFHHQRHDGSSSSLLPVVVGDILLAALNRLHGVSVLDLATRRNMVLLCHAILLVLLGDAGLLTTRRRSSSAAAPERPRHATRGAVGVVWRPRRRRQQVAEARNTSPYRYESAVPLVEEDPCCHVVPPPLFTRPEHDRQVSAGEIVMVVEEQTRRGDSHLIALAGALDPPAAAVDGEVTYRMNLAVAEDHENNEAAEEEDDDDAAGEGRGSGAADQCGDEDDDLDEMNRRFEAFIAETKEKMRLEALLHLQPPHVPERENTRALLLVQ